MSARLEKSSVMMRLCPACHTTVKSGFYDMENCYGSSLLGCTRHAVGGLPTGETKYAAHCCGTLNKLREAVCQKRPGKVGVGVIMLHDTVTPHTSW
jgi:hypothetical protein